MLPSPLCNRSAPRLSLFGAPSHGLRARCLRFVGRVTSPLHARLASARLSALRRRGLSPRGITDGVSTHRIPPNQASPGASTTEIALFAAQCASGTTTHVPVVVHVDADGAQYADRPARFSSFGAHGFRVAN